MAVYKVILRVGHCIHCGRCCRKCEYYKPDENLHCADYENRPITCKIFPVHPLGGYFKDFCGIRFLDSVTLEEDVLAPTNCVVVNCEL